MNTISEVIFEKINRVNSNPDSETTEFLYDEGSRLTRKNLPNTMYELYTYDSRTRVTDIDLKNSSNALVSDLTYTYYANGNIETMKRGSNPTTTYEYDEIGQLESESRTGYAASYTYDANGNRLTKTLGAVTDTYSYDEGDKLTQITRGGSTIRSFTYEKFGRMKTSVENSVTTTFNYDYESRITSVVRSGMTTNIFEYNGIGARVSITDSIGSAAIKRNGVTPTSCVLSSSSSSATTRFTPDISQRVGSSSTFNVAGLKNTDKQFNASQSETASAEYDAFGNVLSQSGSWTSNHKYGAQFGYETDPDTGLKLLGSRYYDSTIGRFVSRDLAYDTRNWYQYCENNPTSLADPDGARATSIVEDTGRGGLIWGGTVSTWAGGIRERYVEGLLQWKDVPRGVHVEARDKWANTMRDKTPLPYRDYLPPRPGGKSGGAGSSNLDWNKIGNSAKLLGRVALVAAIVADIGEYATSDDKGGTLAEIIGGWVGGLVGGVVGAAGGSAIAPGPGSVGGGIVGSGVGYGIGRKAGRWLHDLFSGG